MKTKKKITLNGHTGVKNFTYFGTVVFEVYYYPKFKSNDKLMRLRSAPEKNTNVYYSTVSCTKIKRTFKNIAHTKIQKKRCCCKNQKRLFKLSNVLVHLCGAKNSSF